MEMKTDFEIINRARSGDRTAFGELVRMYQKKVYQLAWNLTGNHQDADDLAQETFIKAYHSIGKFRMESEFKTWIYRIMINTHIDKKRKKSIPALSLLINTSAENDTRPQDTADPLPDNNPENHIEAVDLNKHITRAMKVLSAREKHAFVLKHYQGLSIKEISDIIKTTEGTVKSMLFRSVQKMQKALAFLNAELGLGN